MSAKLFLLKSFLVDTIEYILQPKAQAEANIIQYLHQLELLAELYFIISTLNDMSSNHLADIVYPPLNS
jgi:hypothetical protein